MGAPIILYMCMCRPNSLTFYNCLNSLIIWPYWECHFQAILKVWDIQNTFRYQSSIFCVFDFLILYTFHGAFVSPDVSELAHLYPCEQHFFWGTPLKLPEFWWNILDGFIWRTGPLPLFLIPLSIRLPSLMLYFSLSYSSYSCSCQAKSYG